jgi:hypothetical protein
MARARRARWGVVLAVGFIAAMAVSVLASPAAAHDCSSPGDCEETGGYNGIIAIVGGAAAVAAAAAAAVAATPEGEETDLAIVQVSADRIEVAPDEPAELTLTGWHVGPRGTSQVAMDLVIVVPPGSGLTVVPTTGTGTLVATVSVEELGEETEAELSAQGTWKGRTATATVHVTIGGEYGLRMF